MGISRCYHHRLHIRDKHDNYPLLEIIGVISTNMSFVVTFAFLKREKGTNYAWALDKLWGLLYQRIESQCGSQ